MTRGPEKIEREEGQRRIVVMPTCAGAIWAASWPKSRSKHRPRHRLPPGYFIEYGGQFENQDRATRRLMLIVPVAIAIIFRSAVSDV